MLIPRPIAVVVAITAPFLMAVTAVSITPAMAVVMVCERRGYRKNADYRSKDESRYGFVAGWPEASGLLY